MALLEPLQHMSQFTPSLTGTIKPAITAAKILILHAEHVANAYVTYAERVSDAPA